ncbi:Aldo/keto reductase [Gloeophyllum trabeum ATCC 11539]|uniref:Aldo/keto reductase n=1 Tax=Gloeophyllum trabeum (strain ATCC 11539 / FP-39264 / Madison 617) TaxID=670483 RepID=S7QFM2_GLOTA|nr:Aldo/keto reductase [Gloeophyllum trabeum ATCC 11539]EPQ58227.1 Aldo/keto reductase [Gloeophyllum trabeum ATCC 11539]
MVNTIIKLGGTASNVTVGKIGHGLMLMTWKAVPSPDEECFEAIKAGVDSLPEGAKMFLNSGEFYGPNLSTANLEMLARFFSKYPEYADRTFLSVKGGLKPGGFEPDASLENLRRSVDNINAALKGTKKLDLFEMARVDRKVPIEDAIKNMTILIKEGKFDHIGMSECRAETLRRANSVHPITAVEIEVSPWSYEEETKNVIATAEELNVSVAAYSPIGRGFLTGQIKSLDDLPKDDLRRHFDRFKPENFQHNLALVEDLTKVAERRKITPAQLCIAWVASLGPHMVPIPGSSHKKRTLENLHAAEVDLSEKDREEIGKIIASHEVKGKRYQDVPDEVLNLWG